MDVKQTLAELESLGTAQNRKVYARHGVTGEMYGVSYAHLGKLAKKIKTDQALAEQLWATGNHDARVLATMIADPAAMSASKFDAWVKNLDNYPLSDALATLAAKAPSAAQRMKKWTGARSEWVAATGWNVLARLADSDSDLTDDEFDAYLAQIEQQIHDAKNRARYSMNMALICIGVRSPQLTKKAVAAARRIGKVQVDHGQTGCKTPDAAAYIQKTLDYRQKKASKAKTPKKNSPAGKHA